MRNLHKTILMATVATFVASGAHAAGQYSTQAASQQRYDNTARMNNQQMDSQQRMSSQQRMDARLSNADVKDVQESLNDEGYNIAVDGIWGPQTTRAIRAYQRQNNLGVTGNLDTRTLAELDVDVDGSRDMW